MTEAELKKIKVEWALLAMYFTGRELPDEVIEMYTHDVSEFEFRTVVKAMRVVRLKGDSRSNRMPRPADVINEIAKPIGVPALSRDISARIGGGIATYGYTNPGLAEKYVGPIGWDAVKRMGGWQHLCQTLRTDEMGTFSAQMRELVTGMIESAQREALLNGLDPMDVLTAQVRALPGR